MCQILHWAVFDLYHVHIAAQILFSAHDLLDLQYYKQRHAHMMEFWSMHILVCKTNNKDKISMKEHEEYYKYMHLY